MAEATLTAERARELLDYDPETGVFRWKPGRKGVRDGSVAGVRGNQGYCHIRVDGRQYLSHRLAWLMVYGQWPSEYVDHINCNRVDNRICNLRLANNAQNAQNASKRADNTSGFKGVSFNIGIGKWRAQIKANGRNACLGYFRCPTAAYIAYCKAADEHHGEYARTA